MKNVKNGTDYTVGDWSSAVRVTLDANDEYFGLVNLTISQYQYYDETNKTWTKIDSCSSGLKTCTFTYNQSMSENFKYRIINERGGCV